MTQYEVPLAHSSQNMMQELFEEINDYLGDKEKPSLVSPASPVLSPFNMSTEGEEDEHPVEHIQNDHNIRMDQNESADQIQSTPLQPAMFVESDDEDSYDDRGDTSDLAHTEDIHNEETVCVCYKCKTNQTGYSGHQQANEHTNYDKSTSALSQLSPFKRRSKSSFSYGGNAVGNAKLAHIAGLVKQTLTSTPRDILPTIASSHKRSTDTRRHSSLSTNSTLEKPDSSITPLAASSSTTSRQTYSPSQEENGIYFSSLPSSYKDDSIYSENDTFSGGPNDRNNSNSGDSFNRNVGYQDKDDSWLMMPTGIPDDLVSSMNWGASTDQDSYNQSGSSLYNEQGMDNADQSTQAATADHLDSYPKEKEQLPDDFPLTQQLPFLTPIHRIGEPHSIALRTKLARDVGSHDDRINAYNNAYSHCIMARTDMVPWIKKQYSKGPPSLMLQYTPRRKKSSKSLFGLFKRHSKPDDTPSSTSLAVTCNPNVSKLSVSSARSSILTESINAVSPQPSFIPSDSYFPQGQQPVLQQTSNDAISSFILPTTSPSNDEGIHLSPSDSSGSKAYQNVSNHKSQEQLRRSPSPSRPTPSGKKQSKSLASVAEPVSILKKSASLADMTARSGGSMLKKSPSAASFVGEDFSLGYPNMSSASATSVTENGHFAPPNTKKQRSPSPSPSVEAPSQSNRRRSPSPMSYTPVTTNSSSDHRKRNQLLCPPDSRSPPRQRSRSVSPSPNQARPQRSRSLSPLVPPMRRLSLHEEYAEEPYYAMNHRQSTSPTPTASQRQYAPPPPVNRHLSPRRFTNDDKTRHHRSNSNTSSPGGYHNKEKVERRVHRARSSEYYDQYPSRYPPVDIQDNDSAIMMMDRRSRRGSYAPPAPLHYDEASSYLLPLEEQHLPQRLPPHRRLRSSSPNHPPPLLVSTGRRITEPPNNQLRHRDRGPIPRRRSMMEEEDYYRQDDGYLTQKVSRGSSHPKRRLSSIPHQPPLAKQQQNLSPQHLHDALHDLCAFFQHLPKHVLANYLQDAGGDFFLAKDLCMEDIMANGI